MGTNYYLRINPCSHCERSDEILHIGKSSGGWCFGLHVIPEHNLNSLDDWKKKFQEGIIKNEYRETVSVDEMIKIITERSWDRPIGSAYKNEDEFHMQNGSTRGPNGLVRSKIDYTHCVGHGTGTWDLIVGEFS